MSHSAARLRTASWWKSTRSPAGASSSSSGPSDRTDSGSPTTPPTPAGRSERPDFYFSNEMEIGRSFIGIVGPSSPRDGTPSLRTPPVLRQGPRRPAEHLLFQTPRVPPRRLPPTPAQGPRPQLDVS